MQHYSDNVLYKTRQHILILVSKILRWFIPVVVITYVAGKYLFPDANLIILLLWGSIWGFVIFGYQYFLWSKSYLLITNEKLVKKVRNGLFSKFHMAIHYDNIRDVAFSKNNLLHYTTWAWTLFARSSAAAVWDFGANWTPNIEKIYKIVNYIHNLDAIHRKRLNHIDDILSVAKPGRDIVAGKSDQKIAEVAEKEKNVLLEIKWIKEVVQITDWDRRYIFEHEEDRNHGVYECLRRQVVFAATHDSIFREPDEAIVMKAWKKVVFPVIEFHEIKRKKVSSSSPGLKIHQYLEDKFENLWDYDATLLIWFDI